jgi:hypothetical protein
MAAKRRKKHKNADKGLRFFRDYARKKWPLRGSQHGDNEMWEILLKRHFGFNWVISFVGAASSRDKRRRHGAAAIFAAGSRSHQVKAIFL